MKILVSGSPGIISKSVSLIVSVFKELTMPGVQNKYDNLTVPINWNEKVKEKAEKIQNSF
jgi:hypothetical protein